MHTFSNQTAGMAHLTYEKLSPLRSIKQITGFLQVDYWPFKSFDIFENLEIIHGQHELIEQHKWDIALWLSNERDQG